MKFLMLMIPRVYQPGTPAAERAGADFMPPAEALDKMGKFNEALAKAATMIDIDGLRPPAEGARITFEGGSPKVTEGPASGAKDLIGGYWIFEIGSKEEALEWARRVPAEAGDVIELRPIFDLSEEA
jgi:hypothetical protein